jgi:hypothetical protein
MLAGEGQVGTDENAFVEILGHAGQRHAYLIFQEYKKISGKTIEQAMESEMSGEILNGLLAMGMFSSLVYINNMLALIWPNFCPTQ